MSYLAYNEQRRQCHCINRATESFCICLRIRKAGENEGRERRRKKSEGERCELGNTNIYDFSILFD